MNASKLVLGTAQLGMDYGIANKNGRPDQEEANEIIRKAWQGGIRQFDTAQGYGESEAALGKAINKLGYSDKALVISKFDPRLNHLDKKKMSEALDESLARLCIPSLYGILLHREALLDLWARGLGHILKDFISQGKVKHIGVSFYSPAGALKATKIKTIEIMQIPANILDRRFEMAGVLDMAFQRQRKIYIRSVFLQGLILMKKNEIPKNMVYARPAIASLEKIADKFGMERGEIAVGYLKNKIPEAHLVFGAESSTQVRKNIHWWKKDIPAELMAALDGEFPNISEKILRPDLWPT